METNATDQDDDIEMVKDASPPRNRIREIRMAAGLTQGELAKRLSTSGQQVARLERGERQLTVKWMERLAAALGCRPLEFLLSSVPTASAIRIEGYITEHDRAYPFETDEGRTAAFPGSHERLIAYEIHGAMRPSYKEGDVLVCRSAEGVGPQCLGEECVLQTKAGSLYVKHLQQGTIPGTYRLSSLREPDIDNVHVVWASPVLWVMRRAALRHTD